MRYTDPDGHCPWCLGAALGAVGGAGAQVFSDWVTNKPITLRKTFAAAVGGAIVGGTGGAASELGVAVQVAIVGGAGVVGGVTERAIATGSMDEATKSPTDIVKDFGTNAAGHVVNKAAEAVVTKVAGGAVENLSGQAARAQIPNRQAKVQRRLEGAQQKLDRQKVAASSTTDTSREAAIRSQQQKQTCKAEEAGCAR